MDLADPAIGGTSRRGRVALALVMVLAAAGLLAPPLTAEEAHERVVVGSKNFAESRLLAEMFAQLIEARAGVAVERRLGLAGTQVCFAALRSGAIDLYPEYTGTGLVSILGEPAPGGGTAALNRVRAAFLARWDLWWLSPLGFENAYELAVPRAVAREHELRTLSDLARVAPGLTAGFGYEFVERPDGLPGLQSLYGLTFRRVRPLQQTVKYQAAGAREVDCLDVYTTDGRLLVYDLVVLEDDRDFFPPYAAAPLVRGATLARWPAVGTALGLLAGALDEAAMRRLNLRVEEQGESVARVAGEALRELGLVRAAAAPPPPGSRPLGFLGFLWAQRRVVLARAGEHLGLTALALGLGAGVAVPLGLFLERRRRVAEAVIRSVGVSQTIPSLALLAALIPLFGVGAAPAVIALWVYAIFPMLRATFTGVRDADPQAVEAATALGMTGRQVLLQVRLPLAAPVIMAGVRTAAVITVGTATLAAFIGAGGLGEPIIAGLQMVDPHLILSGALPAAALALLVDGILGLVERMVQPRGLEVSR